MAVSNRYIRITVSFSLLLVILSATAQNPDIDQNSTLEKKSLTTGAVLMVNDDAITSLQVIAALEEKLFDLFKEKSRKQFMGLARNLITKSTTDEVYNLLLYQQAKRELDKMEIGEEAIDKMLAEKRKELCTKYGGSEALADAELRRNGSSLEEKLNEEKRNVIIDSYKEIIFLPTFNFPRSRLLSYYRKHLQDEFTQKPIIHFQLIDIKHEKCDSPAQAAQQAQRAWEKISQGADFAEIAGKFSHGFRKSKGGLWDPIKPNAVRKQYQPVIDALKKIETGQCTGIVRAENRYFIAKLIEHKKAKVVPFGQAQFEISKILRQRRWQKYSLDLSTKLLKKSAVGDMESFISETTNIVYQRCKNKRHL